MTAEPMREMELPLEAVDGHRWSLSGWVPARPSSVLLWLPALGVGARHYRPFAGALAARGVAVLVHEWRGSGSSNLRAARETDWGYRQLLELDLPLSEAAVAAALPDLPRIIGGHSLGGQLACCRLGLQPGFADRLWLVASGAPYWRAFPRPIRYGLPLASRFLPWLANTCGALPGRRIGFGGQEARGVMEDWGRSALSGQYTIPGAAGALETAMAQAAPQINAVVFSDDWLAPPSSLEFLLSKMSRSRVDPIITLTSARLGVRADHFSWMKQPEQLVEALLERA